MNITPHRVLTSLLLLVLGASVLGLGACTVDSYMDPSVTGAYEATPGARGGASGNNGPWVEEAEDRWTNIESALAAEMAAQGLAANGPNAQSAARAPLALALARPGEDIWVIVKPPALRNDEPGTAPLNTDDHPGCGAMVAFRPGTLTPAEADARRRLRAAGDRRDFPIEPDLVPLPLKHTDVHASVAGYIASVNVTQQFHNPFAEKIEAVYQFPLPQDAAVSEFVMTVGPPDDPRRIRGIVREKEEAQQIYRQARAQGLNASLLTQVRPNIFEQKVANIEPGQQIDIDITYFNTLGYADGWYTFVFPMVVGPRFNPPYSDDPVRAVPRGTTPKLDERGLPAGTDIPYLRPDERSGHDIALTLDIDAGVSIEEATCHTHVVEAGVNADGPNADHKLRVELAAGDRIPNKDFVFSFRVAGERMKSGLVTHTGPDGEGYFTLMLYPPADLGALERQPMEMVFVLDCSGSMRGEPLAQAKQAIRRALHHLGPDDTFQVIRFSNNASTLGPRPLQATPRNIERGLAYVDSLSGGGGTMMIEGIKAALDFPHDPRRFRTVTFLTDGYIGNETDILREVSARLGDARIFSFGVGSSVNRFLLERMAKAGRGAAAYLLPGDSANDVMDLYFSRISHPAMTDLALDFGAMRTHSVYPARTPDLLVGRPVIVTGRYTGEPGDIRITGRAGSHDLTVTLDAAQDASTHPALAQVWARRRIADLMDQMAYHENRHPQLQSEFKRHVLVTALEYQLMSQYTAFLAVDASRVTAGDHGTTVTQPLPMPEGVRYDTTVDGETNE
ncbi:VIT and VWA domain-containing protein [Phycisphaeraceae bacterium D3-23]